MSDIAAWQRDFFAQPRAWTVYVRGEETGNLYDSKEAAMVEVEWRRARGEKATVGSLGNMHSLELAQRRWK